jgi:hypothetical protein
VLSRGNVATARGNWLRAINYYLAAVFPLDSGDKLQHVSRDHARTLRHKKRHQEKNDFGGNLVWLRTASFGQSYQRCSSQVRAFRLDLSD